MGGDVSREGALERGVQQMREDMRERERGMGVTGCVYVSFMSTLKSPELRLTIMSVCFNSASQINFANGCFNLVVGILKHFFSVYLGGRSCQAFKSSPYKLIFF